MRAGNKFISLIIQGEAILHETSFCMIEEIRERDRQTDRQRERERETSFCMIEKIRERERKRERESERERRQRERDTEKR